MRGVRRVIGPAACALALAGGALAHGAGGAVPLAVHGGGAPGPRVVRGRSPPSAARPAIWRTYDMIVNFQSLPRTYTCDQLWYEFHGILLRLGAPAASISILPYDCSPSPGGYMRSPHVEVRFRLPFVLQPGVTGAPIEAVERAVRLAPGEPKTLQASDCQLLQQIEQTMLASMPVEVRAAHFDCSAPAPRSGRFTVTVKVPAVAKTGAMAAAGPPSAAPAPR
jgi:hypothetical protein